MLGLGRLRLLSTFTTRLRLPTPAAAPAKIDEEVHATDGADTVASPKDAAEDAPTPDTEHTSLDGHTSEPEHEGDGDEFAEIPTNSDEVQVLEDMEEFINTPTDPIDPASSPVKGTRPQRSGGRVELEDDSQLALSPSPNPLPHPFGSSPLRRLSMLKRSRNEADAADESARRDSTECVFFYYDFVAGLTLLPRVRSFKKTRMGHLNRVPTMAERLEELLKTGGAVTCSQGSGPATPAAQKGVRHLRQHQQDYGSSPLGSSSGLAPRMLEEEDEDDEFEVVLPRPIFNRLEDENGVEGWD